MRHIYSKEEDIFLKDNVKGITLKELTDRFNKKFNYNLSESAIANRKNKLGLSSGINVGCFKKGSVPFNKGKKWTEYMSEEKQKNCCKTTFKKGNIPANHRELFEERISRDGYIEIKIFEPNKWEKKQRYIYEQNHGKIPKGYNVIFADGNNRNFDIDNLILVSDAENLIMNSNNLRYDKKELTKAGHLVAKIIDKGNKIKK